MHNWIVAGIGENNTGFQENPLTKISKGMQCIPVWGPTQQNKSKKHPWQRGGENKIARVSVALDEYARKFLWYKQQKIVGTCSTPEGINGEEKKCTSK